MLTRKAVRQQIDSFLLELIRAGYAPKRVVLFGSYYNGRPHESSDIDLAVWDDRFTGCGTIDVAPIVSLLSRYKPVELHTFNAQDMDNPFGNEIMRKGEVLATG